MFVNLYAKHYEDGKKVLSNINNLLSLTLPSSKNKWISGCIFIVINIVNCKIYV